MAMQNMKIVVVGDGAVGKTSMLIAYSENRFPVDYVPTVFDNFTTGVEYEGQLINLALWDTAGPEEYSRLRALSYPETDVFLVMFSLVSRSSFENVKTKWIPEIEHHCPGVKKVLVGGKFDLRDNEDSIARGEIVAPAEGHALAKELGMDAYVEVSSLLARGLKEVFLKAFEVAGMGYPPRPFPPSLAPPAGINLVTEDVAQLFEEEEWKETDKEEKESTTKKKKKKKKEKKKKAEEEAGKGSDVAFRIIGKEGEVSKGFPSHRLILALSSPVLADLLSLQHLQSTTNKEEKEKHAKDKKKKKKKKNKETNETQKEEGKQTEGLPTLSFVSNEIRVDCSESSISFEELSTKYWPIIMKTIHQGKLNIKLAEGEEDITMKVLQQLFGILGMNEFEAKCSDWLSKMKVLQPNPFFYQVSQNWNDLLWERMKISIKNKSEEESKKNKKGKDKRKEKESEKENDKEESKEKEALLSELTLKAAEGHSVNVHRFMLLARSKHFASLFRSGMSDALAEEIEFSEMSFEALKNIAAFFYLGRFLSDLPVPSEEDDKRTLHYTFSPQQNKTKPTTSEKEKEQDMVRYAQLLGQILQYADQLNDAPLLYHCEQQARACINIKNVWQMLEVGERFNSKNLVDYCLWWMSVNWPDVESDKQFKKLQPEWQDHVRKNRWPPQDVYEKYNSSNGGGKCCIQ